MNQAGGSGVGGTDVPPPLQHQWMHDGVDPEFVTLRNTTRDKISNYIVSTLLRDNLGGMVPELARQLEEILFKMHRCKTGYHNMASGESFEPDLKIAIQFWRGQHRQNQQFSMLMQYLASLGTEYHTPPSITQGEIGNPRMYSNVTGNMGKDLGMSRRSKPNVMQQAKEVSREPKFSCPICMNEMVDASSTICGHLFCEKCIRASVQAQSKCPTCRRTLSLSGFHRVYLPTTD